MTDKLIAKPSFIEMQKSLPRIDECIELLDKINIKTIIKGDESSLLYISQKMEQLLLDIFGNDSHQYDKYKKYTEIRFININMYPSETIQDWVQENINNALVTLRAIKELFLEKLESSKGAGTHEHILKAYEGLELHPEIASATSALFRDGHYSNAIEDAVKSLNNLVRLRTGLLEDGVSLMQKAFSPKNPLLQFNQLKDESDQNEQKGFMEWFTGTVSGLRNPRAHKIIKDDPEMALEFIAFVSLQAKLVDKAKAAL